MREVIRSAANIFFFGGWLEGCTRLSLFGNYKHETMSDARALSAAGEMFVVHKIPSNGRAQVVRRRLLLISLATLASTFSP